MTAKSFALTTIAFALGFPASVAAQSPADWADIRGQQELAALFSNKTLKGNGWTGHYRVDGNGILILASGQREPRTWKVKGDDQVCVTTTSAVGASTNCFRFQRHKKNPTWVTGRNVANHFTFTFTLEEGIPKF